MEKRMNILAIDPGTTDSAYILWNGEKPLEFGIKPNSEIFPILAKHGTNQPDTLLVIEKIESYGMAVGVETFETVHWSGRFHQYWTDIGGNPQVTMLGRKTIKMHLCSSMKAKDGNIRQALLDRFGPVGVKKAPGILYGVSSHIWAALAVAVTHYDEMGGCLK